MSSGSRHKFKIGCKVRIDRSAFGAPLEAGMFEVTRLLPAANGDFQYRIRSLDGRIQRVVLESCLL
ncbi:MAG: hypothetical protein GC190_09995 [Alphaproteobacteria bacterium]|nr:hypothetical protein [Alphaproteobacteria bacterium]